MHRGQLGAKDGSEGDEVVVVQALNKSYGEVKAVKDLSFSVGRGEVFGILGPNGSGKTSTIETILGSRKADSGRISLLGLDPVKERRDVFRRVGVQFQDSAWQTGIRVGELCEATACLYDPIPGWRESLAHFDLNKRIDTPVEALSGGERQKLAILLACIHNPKLIFLDELTTGLDPIARRETWKFITQLRERGSTVILTSHFMDEVETLCQRGLILCGGEEAASGSISELMEIGKATRFEDAYINIIQGGRA